MKKTVLAIVSCCICACLFSYTKEVHQHITREAFNLLRLRLGDDCASLNEMEDYLGYDETNQDTGCPGIGDAKIVAGAYMEDEYDIVYHYGWAEKPNYENTPLLVENSLICWLGNNTLHRTITHF